MKMQTRQAAGTQMALFAKATRAGTGRYIRAPGGFPLWSVRQIGNQLVGCLNGLSAREPGSVAVVQRRQRFDVYDIDVPGTVREMAQPGHVVPAVCDAGDVFLNRFWFFFWRFFVRFHIHRVSFQILIIGKPSSFFAGMGTEYSSILEIHL
jgi:hypothetical protein